MSLWTPDGERPVDRSSGNDAASAGASGGPDILAGLSEEERAAFERLSPEEQQQARDIVAQMAETQKQVLGTPASVIVSNHAMGLYELAAIHLRAESPNLEEAKLAVDALAALVEAVGDRLDENGPTMRDALAQIQLAYVQVRDAHGGGGAASADAAPNAGGS